jgi:hypothetical protein
MPAQQVTQAPPRVQPRAPSPPPSEVPEMEIPTFIRRQMD